MSANAAGLIVDGDKNPNWKGGLLDKQCLVCEKKYQVKRTHASSKFCSLQCVGIHQRGKSKKKLPSRTINSCEECRSEYSVYPAHAARSRCCSAACSLKRRSRLSSGANNPNWAGGLSRLPYPWNFKEISKAIIERDGGKCLGISCHGSDERMTTHHINYDKTDCSPINLIALCSSCNSRANFGRDQWRARYQSLMAARFPADQYPFRIIAVTAKTKKSGGGWAVEEF